VITDIANFLSSTFREENSNDPRSLKRKFDLDCMQAEVAKFGQNDVPPSSYPPIMSYHPNYHREGMHPSRSMSTPQPMVGVESSSSYHPSQISDADYRPSSISELHRSSAKIYSHSPLSILPEIPFSHSLRPSTSYIRHRSLEPVTNTNLSRTMSTDAYRPSKPPSNSHHPQSSQYVHHTPHRSSTLPILTQSGSSSNRRASHPNTSLSFGSDSNLLNPPENNRYEKDDDTSTSKSQKPSSSPSSTSYAKSENPIVGNSTTARQRSPPLPDPPDNDVEYNKRCKRN
ncbi:10501_t:CDS:2, partial [Scutellospora calospora]